MKRDKRYIWTKISAYFSNELSESQLTDFKKNIVESGEQDLFNMVDKDIKAIDKASYMYDQETNEAWDLLRTKIHHGERKKLRIFSYKPQTLLRVAASIVLLIGVSWFGFNLLDRTEIVHTQTQAFQRTETLPDGTTVYLNANSEIQYPEKFSLKRREVKLKGEAYFDVVKDSKRPFVIMTGDARIEVLGTSFNILSNNRENKVEVFVESGSVSLSNIDNHERLILTKGQSGFLQNKSLNRSQINDLNYLSWKTKLIDFREAPLDYVIKVLNKTYASNIRIEDDLTSSLKLNAKFDKVPLDTVVESICLAFDLKYKNVDGRIQLVKNTE